MRIVSLLLGLAVLAQVACGGDGGGGGGTISSGTLSGKIGGASWTFADGQTNAFLSDASTWFADLYDMPIDSPCFGSPPADSTHSLILNIPTAVGTYRLSLALNQTFVIRDPTGATPTDNKIATSGTLQVTEVTATTISGGAKFAYDANNTIDGQFTIDICP